MLNNYKDLLTKKGEVYLRIKASPGSPRTKVTGILDDETIKIDVAAQAQKGKANKELIKYLAKEFMVNKNDVKIISGARERLKLIKIIKL